eukprot:TRINITY_DN2478_c0_g3_i1.p3 TRINITY_DN2478_c0_g3~~TRINITY_DN2478_c0_g3_i1.p3  ORF type:complete len:122 (-),score=41.91 TRINITY_DN2478_c0_g3_i1:144-509(-)
MLCAIALQITIARHTPTRGPPGWAIWAGAAAFVGYGFYGLINGNKRRNAMAREKREARMNIQAFLQADADAQHIRVQRRFMREEEEIMGHVPNWKVGDTVYKSGIYMAPTINLGWPNDLIR